MKTLIRLLGWVAAIAFFFKVMADPKGAADMLVSTGLAVADVFQAIGDFWSWLMKRLDEVRN